jgi:hypothetical protein
MLSPVLHCWPLIPVAHIWITVGSGFQTICQLKGLQSTLRMVSLIPCIKCFVSYLLLQRGLHGELRAHNLNIVGPLHRLLVISRHVDASLRQSDQYRGQLLCNFYFMGKFQKHQLNPCFSKTSMTLLSTETHFLLHYFKFQYY